jgi:hypothetical protein
MMVSCCDPRKAAMVRYVRMLAQARVNATLQAELFLGRLIIGERPFDDGSVRNKKKRKDGP